MLEKLFRTRIKGLIGIDLDLTNLINMDSVAFYETISKEVSVVMLLIQFK